MLIKTVTAALLAAALTACGGGADESGPVDTGTPTSAEDAAAPTDEETTPTGEDEAPEAIEDEGDVAGEEPGVVILASPITFSENGVELVVDAVRILSVEEFSAMTGEDATEYLEDPDAVTLIGMRVTMRNTTDQPIDWYPAGAGSAIVINGQQGAPSFLGDWGDTLRANAELELNAYYESRVPADEARAAGQFIWDAGSASDENYETIADPELTITYTYDS